MAAKKKGLTSLQLLDFSVDEAKYAETTHAYGEFVHQERGDILAYRLEPL